MSRNLYAVKVRLYQKKNFFRSNISAIRPWSYLNFTTRFTIVVNDSYKQNDNALRDSTNGTFSFARHTFAFSQVCVIGLWIVEKSAFFSDFLAKKKLRLSPTTSSSVRLSAEDFALDANNCIARIKTGTTDSKRRRPKRSLILILFVYFDFFRPIPFARTFSDIHFLLRLLQSSNVVVWI